MPVPRCVLLTGATEPGERPLTPTELGVGGEARGMQYSLRVHGLAHATCEQEPILTWAPLRARPGSARNDFVRVALAQCVVAPSPPLREFL